MSPRIDWSLYSPLLNKCSTIERRLLFTLLSEKGYLVPKAKLIREVWTDEKKREDNLRARIKTLRKLLVAHPSYRLQITTRHSVGYLLETIL